MLSNKSARIQLTTFLVFFAGILVACGEAALPDQESNSRWLPVSPLPEIENSVKSTGEQKVYPVDGLFAEFYDTLGGMEVLGPAISPVTREGTRQLQYVENALMVYDEAASTSDRFNLAPLGLEFGVIEAPIPDLLDSRGRSVGGHLIWPEFVRMYDALGGVRFVGKPITEPNYNPTRKRIEQYFENLGVYRLDQDKPGTVRFMAYGAFACDYRCRFQPPSSSIPGRQPNLPEPFQSLADRLGIQFTGRALTGPYQAADRAQEVIFENVVLYNDASSPDKVYARSIVELLGFLAHVPVDPSRDPLMSFYEIEEGKGYNVPRLFEEYIRQHGGVDLSGLPLSEVFPFRSGAFRQCFTNLCLEYDINAAYIDRLKPVPLGARYKAEIFEKAMNFQESLSVKNIDLNIWEEHRWLPANQWQKIFVKVSEAGVALKNREPVLILSHPNGSTQKLYFPPTGSDGQTFLDIPGIQAPNGTLITYNVCLFGFNSEKRCVGENYLIWNSK